jgi:lactate dehydrogenase-like 2-hydroxyacid dehydrogenase
VDRPREGDQILRVLIADFDYEDVEIEHRILEGAGLEVVEAQCRTEEDVVEAGRGVSALLTQYAPITAKVLAELPELRMVGRYGVGYDVVDVGAARERGVWVANVPDYGTEEVAAHALSMALALLRHLPLYDRAVRRRSLASRLHGPALQAQELDPRRGGNRTHRWHLRPACQPLVRQDAGL